MLNLTIYLIKKNNNNKSLNSYIESNYLDNTNLTEYYLDKEYLSGTKNNRGKLYVFEEDNYNLPWANTVNKIAKSKKKIIKKRPGKVKAVVLLEVKNRIFALSFANGITLVKKKYLEKSFGIKTNRKIIDNKKLKSIKSVSLSEGVISNHKYAKKNIPTHSQLDHSPLSIVNDVKGPVSEEIINGFKVTVSGQNQIQLKVSGQSDFLPQLIIALEKLLDIYLDDDEKYINNFHWHNEIKRKRDPEIIEKLDQLLSDKIKKMIKRVDQSPDNEVSKSTLINIELYPDIPDLDETPILGFHVSGIGYPGTTILEKLDEVQIFSRLAIFLKNKGDEELKSEQIISKLKADNIHYYLDENNPIHLSNIYNSLYFQTALKGYEDSNLILIQGKWYEVPKDFYARISKTINEISKDPLGVRYKDFTNEHHDVRKNADIVRSEGKYNSDMGKEPDMVLFDKKNYPITKENAIKNNLIASSTVEPCDLLNYKDGKLQLIHVKRGRSGAGVSHLLSQAYVSSVLYKKDDEFLNHLNKENERKGKEEIEFNNIDNENIVVVLACIVDPEYVSKSNSKVFPLLTAVKIINTISEIRDLGFDCRLIKIPNKYDDKEGLEKVKKRLESDLNYCRSCLTGNGHVTHNPKIRFDLLPKIWKAGDRFVATNP